MRNDDVPGFISKFLVLVQGRAVAARGATLACALLAASPAATLAQGTQGSATFPVGIRELDYIDPHEGGRHLTLRMFYPAAVRDRGDAPDFVEVGEAGIAGDDAMRRQCRVQLVG